MSSLFESEYAKLNPDQQRAVDTIEGPLLVLAGPGSGKTQTVALRTARILRETQARPHHILALSYTNAAAHALKNRLARIVGAEGYGVATLTFHSLAERMATLFPASFAKEKERTSIDELGKYELIQRILSEGRYPALSPLAAPHLYVRDIASLISTVKREYLTEETLTHMLLREEQEVAALPQKGVRSGKKPQATQTRENNMARLHEFVRVYREYLAVTTHDALADFDDMLLSLVEKLDTEDHILAYMQEQFLYITVDEYQDTSGVQTALLERIAGADTTPNLCAVGDDDQSIYRFQGASQENILSFLRRYPAAEVVTLGTNYRSTPELVAASSQLITHNVKRIAATLHIEKRLRSALPAGGSVPIVTAYEGSREEAAGVAERIQASLAAGVPAREIAVLYRRRQDGDGIEEALLGRGIPFVRTDGLDALADTAVQQLIAVMQALITPEDGRAWLAFAAVMLPAESVYTLARWKGKYGAFPDVLNEAYRAEREKELPLGYDHEAYIRFKNVAETLMAEQHVLTASAMIGRILAETRIAEQVPLHAVRALAAVADFVSTLERTTGFLPLTDVLQHVRRMQTLRVPLKLSTESGGDTVTLATFHGSKGLEWEEVYLTRLTESAFEKRRAVTRLKLPEHTEDSEELLEEERRLLFVGMTRAKRRLFLSFGGDKAVPTRFLLDAGLEVTQRDTETAPALPLRQKQVMPQPPEALLRDMLSRYRLSPTGLTKYLDNPEAFLMEELFGLYTDEGVESRFALLFGTAVHSALEFFYAELQRTGMPPPLDSAVERLHGALRKEPLSLAQRDKVGHDAEQALRAYLARVSTQLPTVHATEYSFSPHDVRFEGIPLTGKVDRIDLLSSDVVRFIDYKTGKPKSSFPDDLEKNHYLAQMLFYQVLAESDSRFPYRVDSCVLSYLRFDGSGELVERVVGVHAEQLARMKNLIRTVWAGIQALDFKKHE